jgi:hypothetical protein
MTIQDQYTSTIRQAQETWTDVVESFTHDLQKAFELPTKPFGLVDPSAAIDQVFDFWGRTLEVQRDFAKKFVGATLQVGETVRAQAESVGGAVREQAEAVKEVAREQAEAAEEVAREQAEAAEEAAREQAAKKREQAAKKYENLTKVELQEELGRRDLPKTGTVDELRQLLIDDDQK